MMGKISVLKPRDVVAILEKLGFRKSGKKAPTSNFAIPTVAVQRCPFILEGIYRRFYSAKSPKMLA
jgi:hypothetical protein